ncbi:MAG: right-handed parallel beta-helix repeat-containing protein [Acidobacteriota bacterium]
MTSVPCRWLLAGAAVLASFALPLSAGSLETLTLPGPGGNGGMYLPDLQATYPGVDWQTLDRLYIPAAHYRFIRLGNLPLRSPTNPLVITNSGGQVRVGGLDFHYVFSITGGANWKLTGRWDADEATGHPDFRGHAEGDYANSRGTYGFLVDDAFEDTNSGLGIGGGATDFEVEMVEIRHVGFAGMSVKTDDAGDAHMENVSIHDNYIHDVGSEGVYFGSTQSQPQHKISGLRFFNNRIVRTGTEAVQLGQLGGGSEIHHNVFVWGALDWKSPFQPFQDNNGQLSSREGSVEIHHNVFIGGASKFFILFNQVVAGDTHLPTDRFHLHDNYFSHSRHFGAYFQSGADGVTRFTFEDNFFRAIHFHYDEHSPGQQDFNAVFRIFNTANPIEVTGNHWQGDQDLVQAAGDNVALSGNVNGFVDFYAFADSGFPADFDYLLLEEWADVSTQGAAPIFYSQGDWVMHEGALYECIAPGSHTDRRPPDFPDTWAPRPLPPDDLRRDPDGPYRGIGLLDESGIFVDGFESGDTGAWSAVSF